MAWQHIDKAPRDGTKIIGWEAPLGKGERGSKNVMWWRVAGGYWVRQGGDYNLFCDPVVFCECPVDPE